MKAFLILHIQSASCLWAETNTTALLSSSFSLLTRIHIFATAAVKFNANDASCQSISLPYLQSATVLFGFSLLKYETGTKAWEPTWTGERQTDLIDDIIVKNSSWAHFFVQRPLGVCGDIEKVRPLWVTPGWCHLQPDLRVCSIHNAPYLHVWALDASHDALRDLMMFDSRANWHIYFSQNDETLLCKTFFGAVVRLNATAVKNENRKIAFSRHGRIKSISCVAFMRRVSSLTY